MGIDPYPLRTALWSQRSSASGLHRASAGAPRCFSATGSNTYTHTRTHTHTDDNDINERKAKKTQEKPTTTMTTGKRQPKDKRPVKKLGFPMTEQRSGQAATQQHMRFRRHEWVRWNRQSGSTRMGRWSTTQAVRRWGGGQREKRPPCKGEGGEGGWLGGREQASVHLD